MYLLAKLKIKLSSQIPINTNMSSLFQGALMEKIPYEYATYLHNSQLHPYSISIVKKNDNYYFEVCTLDEKSYKIIIEDTMMKLDKFYIKSKDMVVNFTEKELKTSTKKKLMDEFYQKNTTDIVELEFLTPTAFKQNGQYNFFPDLRCIYQSAMKKYSISSDVQMIDEDTLNTMLQKSKIIGYNIRTRAFHLESIRITGFVGTIKIKITGNHTITNFINMLLEFATYSGIGIKCSIGMGKIILKTGGVSIDK